MHYTVHSALALPPVVRPPRWGYLPVCRWSVVTSIVVTAQKGTAMLLSTALPAPEQAPADALAEFNLDVMVTTDAAVGYTVRRCDTSDTCGSTCASACASS